MLKSQLPSNELLFTDLMFVQFTNVACLPDNAFVILRSVLDLVMLYLDDHLLLGSYSAMVRLLPSGR